MEEEEQKKNSTNTQNSTDSEPDPQEEAEESKAKTKAGKFVDKHKSKAKRSLKSTKQKIVMRLQFVLFGLFIVVFASWGAIENLLTTLSGFDKVTIVDKQTTNGCFEIIIQTNESFCVDENSYNLANIGENYKLREMQYHHSLSVID